MLSWCVLIRKDKLALRARTWYSFLLGSSSLRTATASTVGRRAGIFVNMSTKANTTTRGGTPHGARALAAKTSGRKHAAKAVPVSHYGSNSLEETRSEVCGGTQKKKSLSGTPRSLKSPRQNIPRENLFEKKLDPPYEEYWSKELVQQGLKRGELIQGVVRINLRNYEEAFIDDPEGGPDYCIPTQRSRNRALQDDVVVVQVLPRDKWIHVEQAEALFPETPPTDMLDTIAADRRTLGPQSDSAARPRDHLDGSRTDISKDDPMSVVRSQRSLEGASASQSYQQATETEGASLVTGPSSSSTEQLRCEATPLKETLVDRLYATTPGVKTGSAGTTVKKGKEDYLYKRTVKVVYIVENGHSRACAGYLKAYDKVKQLVLFSPKDHRVPRVILPLADCPPDYCLNHKKHESTMFICRIQQWMPDALFPNGTLMRSLGEAGEIEPETESFLLENEIDSGDFTPEALDCLPKNLPWTLPKEEETKRRDFRRDCVFSIDPATAKDLDDALHVKKLDSDVYEVGVHIADVSYFVTSGTALDDVASKRATSVYLVQRVIPMLPPLLCEQLCSLNPNEDRLTFSVVWQMTSKGEFLSEWMGRSIIRSCAKLSYDHAQQMIDDPHREWKDDELPPIAGGFSASQVSEAVNFLNKLAVGLRAQRKSKGTLRLDQPKLSFSLDTKTGMPNGCFVYQHKESNKLIEEFMLLANMAVARRIQKAFPETSLLRRHPKPKQKSADFLAAKCAALGIKLDVSSAESIQRSLDQYHGRTENKETTVQEKMILVALCSKIMELARYFCTGAVEDESEFNHFALNVPRYTHFTSPIRRYADIIVHRQLAHALGEGPTCTMTTDEVEAQADHCNKKKKAAKTVEELSGQLFFSLFLSECGPEMQKGMVMQVLNKAFDVLVSEFGVVKRVYCEKLNLKSYQYELHGKNRIPRLTLVWSNSGDSTSQELTVFTPVDVVLFRRVNSLQVDATILPPIVADANSSL